jgi:hypothetical protein
LRAILAAILPSNALPYLIDYQNISKIKLQLFLKHKYNNFCPLFGIHSLSFLPRKINHTPLVSYISFIYLYSI